jgi:hypothetical protein
MLTFKQFVVETTLHEISLGRLNTHVHGRNIGMMTAFRGDLPHHENLKRNEQLEGDIKKHGFGYKKVRGRYIENHGSKDARPVDEHSFLVMGKKKGHDNDELKNFMTKHGEKYGQDSVFHKAHDAKEGHLIGTKEGVWPGKGEHHPVGQFHPNQAGEFHSILKGKANATPDHAAGNPFKVKHGLKLRPTSTKTFEFSK